VNRRRLIIWGAVVLVVAALVVGRLRSDGGAHQALGPRAGGGGGGAPVVTTAVVGSESVSDRVSAIGTIRSNEEVQLRPEISGRIDRVLFKEGSRVTRGDLLVKINDAELRAQLERAEARLALATSDFKRQQSLHADSLTSASELEGAQHDADVARAEAAIIRAQLQKTEIRAPFDGIVGLRSVSEGSFVTPTTIITGVEDRTPVKLEFSVPERYAARMRVGDRVRFRIEGIAREFEASVYALDSAIEPATRSLRIRATSDNQDGTLVPGAFAHVDVEFGVRDAVMVPSYAVVPELKGHRVFVLRGGKAELRKVEIGTRTDQSIEVVTGLAAGDTLITSAILQLKDGDAVRVDDSK